MNRDEQIQAIIARLTGAPEQSLPQSFELDEPLRRIYQRVRGARSREEAAVLLAEAAGPDGLGLFTELLRRLPEDGAFSGPHAARQKTGDEEAGGGPAARFPSLRDIPARATCVSWLWPSWIAYGTVTLLAAAPGVGKSLVALDLARRITSGEAFPDGTPVAEPGRPVVLVDAELAPGLLRQRVDAWQIDAGLLFPVLASRPGLGVDLVTVADARRLVELCRAVSPALVIIDSLASAAARSETSVRSAREVLGSLATLAQLLGPAVLVIHHLRKGRALSSETFRPTIADLRGSSHLIAVARSILALSLDAPDSGLFSAPDPNPPRRLEVLKTNLCPAPAPLRLVLEQQPGAPCLRYSPLVEAPPPQTMLRLCAEWLLGYLAKAGGAVQPAEAIASAREAGFAQATVYRARKALGAAVVETGTGPYDPYKRWALAATGTE